MSVIITVCDRKRTLNQLLKLDMLGVHSLQYDITVLLAFMGLNPEILDSITLRTTNI